MRLPAGSLAREVSRCSTIRVTSPPALVPPCRPSPPNRVPWRALTAERRLTRDVEGLERRVGERCYELLLGASPFMIDAVAG
jgi:hypothetical protein